MDGLADKTPMLDACAHYHDACAQLVASDPANAIARRQPAPTRSSTTRKRRCIHDLARASYLKALAAQQAMVAHDASDQDIASGMAESLVRHGRGAKAARRHYVVDGGIPESARAAAVIREEDPDAAMEFHDFA